MQHGIGWVNGYSSLLTCLTGLDGMIDMARWIGWDDGHSSLLTCHPGFAGMMGMAHC